MNARPAPQAPSAPNSALKANISQLLKLDLQHAERLISVLKEERKILQQHDKQQLAALVEEKDQLLSKLDQSAKLRSQWLEQLGLELSAESWQILIIQQQDEELSKLWQSLDSHIIECRELNDINGRLIGRSQQTLAKLLNILRGNKTTPQLYGRDGSTRTNSESRCFTQA